VRCLQGVDYGVVRVVEDHVRPITLVNVGKYDVQVRGAAVPVVPPGAAC
jgi:hypothetical protein